MSLRCYVLEGEDSTCPDLVASGQFKGEYWSVRACATPGKEECLRQVGGYRVRSEYQCCHMGITLVVIEF